MEGKPTQTLYIDKWLWIQVLSHCEKHKLSPTELMENYLRVMLNPIEPLPNFIKPSGVRNIQGDCQRRIEDLELRLRDAGVEY